MVYFVIGVTNVPHGGLRHVQLHERRLNHDVPLRVNLPYVL